MPFVLNPSVIETPAAAAVIVTVALRSRWTWRESLRYFFTAAAIGTLLLRQFEGFELPGLIHGQLGSLCYLFGAGLSHLIFFARKTPPLAHQGGLFLICLTFLYTVTTVASPWCWGWLTFFTPFFLLLCYTMLRDQPISVANRYRLSMLYSACYLLIGLHQLSFLDAARELQVSGKQGFEFFLSSYSIQLSLYWVLFHAARFVYLLPLFGSAPSYRERITQEILPEYSRLIGSGTLPPKVIALAVLLHVTPIALNLAFHLVPEAILIAYLMTVSPALIDRVLRAILKG